jgi:hypothetical protein
MKMNTAGACSVTISGVISDDFIDIVSARCHSRLSGILLQSIGQGFGHGVRAGKDTSGVPGGIGILIDEKGDDTYIADYFAQGASYYYGVGILNDMDGDDQYLSGRYSQGAGIHSS